MTMENERAIRKLSVLIDACFVQNHWAGRDYSQLSIEQTQWIAERFGSPPRWNWWFKAWKAAETEFLLIRDEMKRSADEGEGREGDSIETLGPEGMFGPRSEVH